MTPFVILALHRTGSTFLVDALNGHPDIVCAHAIFNPTAEKHGIDLNDPIGSMDGWLDARKDTPFVGFKLMLDQNNAVLHEIARRQYHVIFLTRPNELARHSSQLIARKTGKRARTSYVTRIAKRLFEAANGSYNSKIAKLLFDNTNRFVKDRTEKIEFDRKRFQRMRKRTEMLVSKTDTILAEHDLKPLRIEYPQITTQETMRETLRFIGAAEMDLVSPVKKMNPPNILERFSNPDEVLQFLNEAHAPDWMREDITA
jgi:hypothetical protein